MKNRNAIVAVVLIAVIVAASITYYFTLPPSVTLLMKDPPSPRYASSVTHVWITFNSIQMHQVRSGGDTWINLTSKQNVTIDLIAIITTTQNLGRFSIPTGNYTEMRFSVIAANATITGVGTVSLALTNSPNSLKIPFTGKVLLSAAQSTTITIDIRADPTLLVSYSLMVTMTASVS